MTTVGYGDKTPKSAAGRLFSVVWVLTGVTCFNLLASTLMHALYDAPVENHIHMVDRKVGTLGRVYDNSLVLGNGGILITSENTWSTEAEKFFGLLDGLKLGKIDGFLLDKITYRTFKDSLTNQAKESGRTKDVFSDVIVVTDIAHSGDDVAYGILVKNKLQYEVFAPTFQSNQLTAHHPAIPKSVPNFRNRGTTSPGIGLAKLLKGESITRSSNLSVFRSVLNINFPLFLIPIIVMVSFGILFELW